MSTTNPTVAEILVAREAYLTTRARAIPCQAATKAGKPCSKHGYEMIDATGAVVGQVPYCCTRHRAQVEARR